MKIKSIIIGIIIGICIATVLGIIIIQFNNNENKIVLSNNNDNNTLLEEFAEIKIEPSKNLVYDADYTLEGYEETWYYLEELNKECSLSNIKVPYININSKYADKINKDLKNIYDEIAGYYKEEVDKTLGNSEEDIEPVFSYDCNYNYYINNNILSVCVHQEFSGTDSPYNKYYTCNLNLKDGSKVEFKDAYEYLNFSKSDLDKKVGKSIENYETYIMMKENQIEDDELINSLIKNSIKKYEDNNFEYFIGKNNVLNIIVELEIPAGGGEFNTVFQIHKEDKLNNYELYKNKENKSEPFVTYKTVEDESKLENSYTLDDDMFTVWNFAERVNAPYININSKDAKKVNEGIEEEYNKVSQMFENEILSDKILSDTAYGLYYYSFIEDYYLSVILVEEIRNSKELNDTITYMIYNFDLSTGKLIRNEDLFKFKGYTEKEIDEKIKNEIKDFPYIKCYEAEEYDKILNNSIKYYNEAKDNNEIKYSLNSDGEISAYLKLEIPGYYEFSEIELKITK